jgi:hypothetical protein
MIHERFLIFFVLGKKRANRAIAEEEGLLGLGLLNWKYILQKKKRTCQQNREPHAHHLVVQCEAMIWKRDVLTPSLRARRSNPRVFQATTACRLLESMNCRRSREPWIASLRSQCRCKDWRLYFPCVASSRIRVSADARAIAARG